MSTVTLTMPRLGETMEEGTVASWLIAEGAAFDRGAPLVEFETDKTAVEYPALGPGRLIRVLVAPGDLVTLGAPIAEIDLEGAEDWVTANAEPASEPEADPQPVPQPDPQPEPTAAAPRDPAAPLRATPPARRAAARAGIALEAVAGTGRRGRIELHDIPEAATGALAASHFGPADGPPVLMAHGFAGDRSTFDQLAKGLARAGLSVRTVDLPGHGETAAEAKDIDTLVDALAATLTPARPVHLVGHSLGAAVATLAASRVPGGVRSLTLIAPAGLGLSIDAEFIHGMAEASSPATTAHLLRRLSKRADAFSAATVAQIHSQLAEGRLKPLAAALVKGGRQALNIRAALTSLSETHRIRILTGTQDQVVNWRDALDLSPRIALHVFDGAGHMPHWDDPQQAVAIIAQGLTE